MKKLVRDFIPQIIPENERDQYRFTQTHGSDYWTCLKEKLVEEAQEFQKDETEEELADLFEVIDAILQLKGWSEEKIRNIQMTKSLKRGSFKEQIVMEKIEK